MLGNLWPVKSGSSLTRCVMSHFTWQEDTDRNSSSHTKLTQNSEVRDLYCRAGGTATEFVSLLELTYLFIFIYLFISFEWGNGPPHSSKGHLQKTTKSGSLSVFYFDVFYLAVNKAKANTS